MQAETPSLGMAMSLAAHPSADAAELEGECRRFGMTLTNCPMVGAGPVVIVAGEIDERILADALSPPLAGLIEQDNDGALCRAGALLPIVQAGGIGISLTTKSAWSAGPATLVAAAIAQRWNLGQELAWDVDLAIQEAVTNALIHGNLGIESDLRTDLNRLKAFNALLAIRLSSPLLQQRRLTVTAGLCSGMLEVGIIDEGDGFDPVPFMAAPKRDAAAKIGRGLGLIRQITHSVSFRDEGRHLTMGFRIGR